MPRHLDESHDPGATSWVESASAAEGDFPLQNLPFGVFRRRAVARESRVGIAIGDRIVDVCACLEAGLLAGESTRAAEACAAAGMDGLLSLGPAGWSALRRRVSALLRRGHPDEARHRASLGPRLIPMAEVDLLLPADIGDYTDFYASIFHAANVGRMLRPDNPLLPNYRWVPIGYHGRASSLVVSGTPIRRPRGQTKADGADAPVFGPSRRLDYELEVGALVGPGNQLGRPVTVSEAEDHVFGLCLVNDWSARDMQAWEYQPLGPFLAKSFATSLSPWIVTLEALEPYRVPPLVRPAGDPAPLPYLDDEIGRERGGFGLVLEVYLQTARMREIGMAPVRLSRGSFRDMYWTVAQLVAHHTSNGCNLRPGDLIASGTVSGADPDSRGCLLELACRGQNPIALPSGETRAFLEDGDEVVLRGFCVAPGRPRIGFGECCGRVEPAAS